MSTHRRRPDRRARAQTTTKVRAVQELRRGNAATPHGTRRTRSEQRRRAIRDQDATDQ